MQTLRGQGPEDLTELCLNLCAGLLALSGKGGQEECCALARKQLGNGEAFRKLKEMVKAQGGDESALEDFSRLPQASFRKEVFSSRGASLPIWIPVWSARPPLSWERAEREKETLLITAPELSFIKSRETLCGKATV